MLRRLPLSIWSDSFSDVNSLLASAVCHLTVLVTLGLLVTAGGTSSTERSIDVDISQGPEVLAPDDSLLREAVQGGAAAGYADDPTAAAGPVRLFADATAGVGDFGTIAAPTDMVTGDDRGAGGNDLVGLGDVEGGAGSGGSGLSSKKATEFFGIEGYGQKFVYVVDCSGSMNEAGKFQRAVYELLQSIEQLKSDQQYFVIFYNHLSYPMNSPGLVRATKEQFEKTRNWVSFAMPQGGTVPQPALLEALKMKPDAIFFLSDGLFDSSTERVVRTANRGKHTRIPIHTIAFVNRENEALMRMIASNSGGKYRYVP